MEDDKKNGRKNEKPKKKIQNATTTTIKSDNNLIQLNTIQFIGFGTAPGSLV